MKLQKPSERRLVIWKHVVVLPIFLKNQVLSAPEKTAVRFDSDFEDSNKPILELSIAPLIVLIMRSSVGDMARFLQELHNNLLRSKTPT